MLTMKQNFTKKQRLEMINKLNKDKTLTDKEKSFQEFLIKE